MRRFLYAAHPVWRVAVLAGLLACLVGASSPVQAQELDLAWATSAGGKGHYGTSTHIAVDGAGNSYVTGYFFGTATFGKGETRETRLSSPLYQNTMFVAKYDQHGQLVWATQAAGPDQVISSRIAVDRVGQSYVTGEFRGTATFGPGEIHETALTARGFNDWNMFIAKYDRDGRLLWARRDGAIVGTGLAVDRAGNSYVTGPFYGTTTFGGGETHETTLTRMSQRVPDIFVAKYDLDGRLL